MNWKGKLWEAVRWTLLVDGIVAGLKAWFWLAGVVFGGIDYNGLL